MRFAKQFHFRLIGVSTLILLATLILATSLIFNQYQVSMVNQNEKETLRAFVLAEKKIERLLSDAGKTASVIKWRKEVDDYLFGDFVSEIQRVMARQTMMHVLSEFLLNNYYLNGIFFFQEDGTMVGTIQPWRFSFEEDSHPFYKQARLEEVPLGNDIVWLGGYRVSDFTLKGAKGKATDDMMIIGASRTSYHYSYNSEEHALTTVLSISEEALKECFDPLNDNGEEIFLLDRAGKQLLGAHTDDLGQEPWFYETMDTMGDSMGGTNAAYQNEKYQLIFYPLKDTGWTLVKQIPFTIYTSQIQSLQKITWLLVFLVLLVMGVVYALWAMRFTRPFKDMTLAIKQVRKGDITVQMDNPYQVEEFELIRTEFNSMIHSINDLLEQTKTMEQENLKLELRNLQSQLNPHMVFNSISAIRWMAMVSGAYKVSDMLVELTELIRPIFSEWRLVWTLREEINYIQHYVKLLRLRHGGMVHVDIFIEEDIMNVLLPCFTLQPLLENSAEHGVRELKPLHITLEGRRVNNRLQLKVKDNGRGIGQEKLKILNERLAGNNTDIEEKVGHTGIGLINIHRRLGMFGGEGSGLVIESEEHAGTTITLWLPADGRIT